MNNPTVQPMDLACWGCWGCTGCGLCGPTLALVSGMSILSGVNI